MDNVNTKLKNEIERSYTHISKLDGLMSDTRASIDRILDDLRQNNHPLPDPSSTTWDGNKERYSLAGKKSGRNMEGGSRTEISLLVERKEKWGRKRKFTIHSLYLPLHYSPPLHYFIHPLLFFIPSHKQNLVVITLSVNREYEEWNCILNRRDIESGEKRRQRQKHEILDVRTRTSEIKKRVLNVESK